MGVCLEMENGRLVIDLDVQLAKNKRLIVQTGLLTDKINSGMIESTQIRKIWGETESVNRKLKAEVAKKEELVNRLKEKLGLVAKNSLKYRLSISKMEKASLETAEEVRRLAGLRHLEKDKVDALLDKEAVLRGRIHELKTEKPDLLVRMQICEAERAQEDQKTVPFGHIRARVAAELAQLGEERERLTAELASIKSKIVQLELESTLMAQKIALLTKN